MARINIPWQSSGWGLGHAARVGDGSRDGLDYGKNRARAFFEAQSAEKTAGYIPTTSEAGKPLRGENKADSYDSEATSTPRFDRLSPPACPPKRKTRPDEWVNFDWWSNLNNAGVSRREVEIFFTVDPKTLSRWWQENRIPEYYLVHLQNWLEWQRKVRKTGNP